MSFCFGLAYKDLKTYAMYLSICKMTPNLTCIPAMIYVLEQFACQYKFVFAETRGRAILAICYNHNKIIFKLEPFLGFFIFEQHFPSVTDC